MEEVTNNAIGETETLFGAGLGGILYGLLAVQPLTVLAFVGPVLVYESIIYRVCGAVVGVAWVWSIVQLKGLIPVR